MNLLDYLILGRDSRPFQFDKFGQFNNVVPLTLGLYPVKEINLTSIVVVYASLNLLSVLAGSIHELYIRDRTGSLNPFVIEISLE